MAFWAVVQTISGREDLVATMLSDSDFDVFNPKTKIRVARHEWQIVPLFPGYLFVSIVDRWYAAARTIGVLRILMAGDHPARCPDVELERIQASIGNNGLVRLPKKPKLKPQHGFAVGQPVRVLSGSFTGFDGLYAGMSVREREQVLLDLLGRKVHVELGPDDRLAEAPALAISPKLN